MIDQLSTLRAIDGGIAAPAGFRAAGVACGIKPAGALDLALIVPDTLSSGAAVFTTNLAQAAPVIVSREHLRRSGGRVAAIVTNSGCANACTGDPGLAVARGMADETARLAACPVEQVLVASTGVIGVALDLDRVRRGIASAVRSLARDGHADAARAIMTTDPWPKEAAVRVETDAGVFHVGGMAKGSGMIEPNLATMLAYLTTDAAIGPAALQRALVEATDGTFNAITVDGECSTNDSVFLMASGASGVEIDATREALFAGALATVCRTLALAIVRGGEGATKLVAIRVTGAASKADARRAARTIANAPLVKTALHGGDPNWGRLIAAAGRAGVAFDLTRAAARIGQTVLFAGGRPFDEAAPAAAEHLRGDSIDIEVDLGTGGPGSATVWTCDLSAEYVRINADYRS